MLLSTSSCSSVCPLDLCASRSNSRAATAEGSSLQVAEACPAEACPLSSSTGDSPPKSQPLEQLASLKACMHAPFTLAEVAAHCKQLKIRKARAGNLPP